MDFRDKPLICENFFFLSHDILGYAITLGPSLPLFTFIYPLELGKHMFYG